MQHDKKIFTSICNAIFAFKKKFSGAFATANVTWCYSPQIARRWTQRVAAELLRLLSETTSRKYASFLTILIGIKPRIKTFSLFIVEEVNKGCPSCKDLARSEWCAWFGSAPDSHRVVCMPPTAVIHFHSYCEDEVTPSRWGHDQTDTLATTALVVPPPHAYCRLHGYYLRFANLSLIVTQQPVSLHSLCWAIHWNQIG